MIDHAPSPDRLQALATLLERIDLTGVGDGAERRRLRAMRAARDYLAPRIGAEDDTLVVAVIGLGGSGKSTMLNSLAGRPVSPVGALRPTTSEPIAWTSGAIPETLAGLRSEIPGSLVDSWRSPPEGVVLVDTPPPEIVGDDGRSIVRRVLEVADAVLFVTSAVRYADAAGFDLLAIAESRGLSVIVVLNRAPVAAEDQRPVAADLASRLARLGILRHGDTAAVTTVAEGAVSPETGGLSRDSVLRVRKELETIADPQARPDVIRSAIRGTLRLLSEDLRAIRGYVIDAEVRRVELVDRVRAIYRAEADRLFADVASGSLSGVAPERLLDRLVSAVGQRTGMAARVAAEAWREREASLVEAAPGLFTHDPQTPKVARERLGFWLAELDDLSRAQGRRLGRRRRATLVGALIRSALDPRGVPRRAEARLLRRFPGLASAARRGLAEEIDGIFASDARRFTTRVGPPAPGHVLSGLEVSE